MSTKPRFRTNYLPNRKAVMDELAVPITLALVGISAITVGLIMAGREFRRLVDDEEANVENYDIVTDKPFIYSICE